MVIRLIRRVGESLYWDRNGRGFYRQCDCGQPGRQGWVDVENTVGSVGAQSKHRLQQVNDTARRPRLRDVGADVLRREGAGLARQA